MKLKLIPKVFTLLAVGSALLAITSNASAGLILDQTGTGKTPLPAIVKTQTGSVTSMMFPKRKTLDMESYVTERISQSGEPSYDNSIIKGAGKGVMLREGLHQIIPLGWKVFTDGPVDLTRKFNWVGNKSWILVLHSMMETNSLNAFIDWNNKEITLFSPIKQKDESKLSDADLAKIVAAVKNSDVTVRVESVSSATDASAKLPQIQPSAPSIINNSKQVESLPQSKVLPPSTTSVVKAVPVEWTMNPDKTVKENLEDWVSKSPGWRLVWSARTGEHIYDYPSKPFVGYTFKGELLGTTGVISRVVSSFVDSNPALAVEFFTENKVIEISLYKPAAEQFVSPGLKSSARSIVTNK